MAARGVLTGHAVRVPDEKEASTLHNKGSFGVPQRGGALELDLVEALYLVENQRLQVASHDAGALLRLASAQESEFDVRYLVYRDLRGRGFVVKHSNLMDYNCYPRGALPGREASRYLVRCASERGSMDPAAVGAEAARAERFGKSLLLAVVDEEGDLTYYDARIRDLEARNPALPGARATARLLGDRVVVLDEGEGRALFEDGYFGRAASTGLHLSLPEALYLAEADRLVVLPAQGDAPLSLDEIARRAREAEPEFDLRHALYRHLRQRGVVVKTGFKYGTHFRAYLGDPDEGHAPFLVHAVEPGRALPWPEVAGFVRLAHGVRKRLFFAGARPGGFDLLELARRKP